MRCITVTPDHKLIIDHQDIPQYQPEQLLVKVGAFALNRADLLQREGKYPPPAGESAIPGLELAGEVVAIGEKVKHFKVGDRVYGLVSSGAYAEYCCVDQFLAQTLENSWDYTYAAAIPEALTTAYATLCSLGNLQADQRILVHAISSGITTMAVQMSHRIGAIFFSTTSSKEKEQQALKLFGLQAINYKTMDFTNIIPANSLDLIIDYIGQPYFAKHLSLLKTEGQLIQMAMMHGRFVELDLGVLLKKRLKLQGFNLRHQSLPEKRRLWQSAHIRWGNDLISQSIKPIIDSVFSFTDIELAHQRMYSNSHFGKIVISPTNKRRARDEGI